MDTKITPMTDYHIKRLTELLEGDEIPQMTAEHGPHYTVGALTGMIGNLLRAYHIEHEG